MNSFIKAVLVVAGIFFLLVVAAGVGGYLWFKHNKSSLLEGAKATIEEGTRFGAGTDNNGCLEEAIARVKKDAGLKDQIKTGLFIRGCLNASKPSPGFCDNVPSSDEMMKSITWRLTMAKKYGLDDNRVNIFEGVQKYCDECRKQPK